jgi:hypothetical protein
MIKFEGAAPEMVNRLASLMSRPLTRERGDRRPKTRFAVAISGERNGPW